jgi:D-alanyl-lipoteichoic acid acyltransferase DltB (MBOAT superfamily)
MIFNSFAFAAFFSFVYLLFLVVPVKFRCWYLVIASFCFYSFVSIFACGILLLVSLLTFVAGLKIAASETKPRDQKWWLFGTIGTLCALLCYFKYFNFIARELGTFFNSVQSGHPQIAAILMPLGLSYYIFQAVGYLVDVFWGKEKENNLGRFLLFISFFPKVMMGPIERSETFLPQIRKLHQFEFNYDNFRAGGLQFGWGLFKKIAVAERLGFYVNEWYSAPSEFAGVPILLAAIFFSFQLYADFSGYTDMALGVARVFNFQLINNFDRPFYATNIQDFWRRWHISFSSWIAIYIFTPLRMQFRNYGKMGLCAAVLITFLLLGIWHGTGWTFVLFGLMHGIFVCVSTTTLRARDRFFGLENQPGKIWLIYFRRLTTFAMVTFSFVFFRATSVANALEIFRNMISLKHLSPLLHSSLGMDRLLTMKAVPEFAITVALIALMEVGEFMAHSPNSSQFFQRPLGLRWAVYAGLALAILCFGVFTDPQAFIYLKF